MKQYPSNRVLKKKVSKLKIFTDNSFTTGLFGYPREQFSDEAKIIIKKAIDITNELSKNEEVSRWTSYIRLGNDEIGYDDVGGEYDTCDSDECMEQALSDAKENFPNQDVSNCLYANDGDHGSIERCCVCNKPLNEWLTWVKQESEYFTDEQNYWDKDLIKNNAFYLSAIFRSIPSNDYEYAPQRSHWYPKEKFEKDCYKFYTPLIRLALYINQNFK